jgi:type I restriction enzyme R subunit
MASGSFSFNADKLVITCLTLSSSNSSALAASSNTALAHFPNVDRTLEGFEGLEAAQNAINNNDKKDAFARDHRNNLQLKFPSFYSKKH